MFGEIPTPSSVGSLNLDNSVIADGTTGYFLLVSLVLKLSSAQSGKELSYECGKNKAKNTSIVSVF